MPDRAHHGEPRAIGDRAHHRDIRIERPRRRESPGVTGIYSATAIRGRSRIKHGQWKQKWKLLAPWLRS
jgi:hypothetical protein